MGDNISILFRSALHALHVYHDDDTPHREGRHVQKEITATAAAPAPAASAAAC